MRFLNALIGVLPALAIGTSACVGSIGAPDDEDPNTNPQALCGEGIAPGPSPIRRMTRFEYNNTVRDLLGDTTNPADVLGAEQEALGFNNNAEALVVSASLAEKYMLVAEGISERATVDVGAFTGCPSGDSMCIDGFISSFGKRAYRRALTPQEATDLRAVYDKGVSLEGQRLGARMVIETALQSTAFLYRVEYGTPDASLGLDAAGVVRVSSNEMASRLSYFLWGTMPDEDLFAAAEADQLSTKDQIEAAARRMLDDPRARPAIRAFHEQWLDFYRVSNITKDVVLFPDWSKAIGDLMAEEARTFVEGVIFEGGADHKGGTFNEMLTAPYSYMNKDLATFYGVEGGGDDAFSRVALDPKERAGILSLGVLLSVNAHTDQTSPVHRGVLVRERFLCDFLKPPPADVKFEIPTPSPNATTRERFAEHSNNEACAPCHQLMDSIGFGFENFDSIGRYRTEENGKPIDASGNIVESDVDGDFVGVAGLAERLASSEEVQQCYVKQWFRYAYGRGESDEDTCTVDDLSTRFEAAQGNIKELLVSLTQTEAFLYRKAGDL